jgi:hypothetical protein
VSGDGSPGAPFTVGVLVDPASSNLLVCNETGLYAAPPTVDDTSCIEVSGTGTVLDPYVITPVIDPDLDNILECGIAGLFVDGSNIPVAGVGDTNCILLSGDGTVGDPLLATPVIAAVAGNILECGASGLVAGGADFKTWVTAISTAANFGAAQAATVTYLATLP